MGAMLITELPVSAAEINEIRVEAKGIETSNEVEKTEIMEMPEGRTVGDAKATKIPNGWKKEGIYFKYYKNGKVLTKWQKIGKNIFYFSNAKKSKGQALTGWRKISGKTYYFSKAAGAGKKGRLLTGWQKIGGKKYYFSKAKGFGKKGRMLTGWVTINGKRYFFDKKGVFIKEEAKPTSKPTPIPKPTPTPKPTPMPTTVVEQKDIKDYRVDLSGVSKLVYNGKEHKPTIKMYNESWDVLKLDQDYTVGYADNIDAGKATIIIQGKGQYKGTINKPFTIARASAEFNAKISSNQIGVGGPASTITATRIGDGKITYQTNNPDIATVDSNGNVTAVSAGIAYIYVAMEETKNYNGGDKSFTLYVAGGTGLKYNYEVFFLSDYKKYKGLSTPVFIKTNNPNPETIRIMGIGGKEAYALEYFEDVRYTGNNYLSELFSVEGGYIAGILPEKIGENEIKIKEIYKGCEDIETYKYRDELQYLFGNTTGTKLYFTAYDAEATRANWINEIIANNTDPSNSFEQNMTNVENYILSNFNYPTNNSGFANPITLVQLTSEAGALWDIKQIDSFYSPGLLGDIAKILDKNCKVEYLSGDMHAYVYLTPQDGTKGLYLACPEMGTGAINPAEIEMVDFSKFQ